MSKVKKVRIYKTDLGVKPLSVWIESLDTSIATRIYDRIERLAQGNLGDYKSLGGGLYEFRLHFGSGYRMYYFEVNGEVIVLLCGGNKAKQRKDISNARKYMVDYRRRYL